MANEYLKRTPTSTGNRKVFTWSAWIKRNKLGGGSDTALFASTSGDVFRIRFAGSDKIDFIYYNGTNYGYAGTQVLRDTGGWMHIMISLDSTDEIGDNRMMLFINGVHYIGNKMGTQVPINTNFPTNSLITHWIGCDNGPTGYWNGQTADVFFIDGQALTPDVFGFYKEGKGYISAGSTQATDFRPGQWVPKTPRVIKAQIERNGGFGVNGYYLPMNDSSNFGADFHTTPNSIIKLQEDLPQPKVSIASTAQAGLAYTDVLRADPYAANLVLALPFVSGGLESGLGDYSHLIRNTGIAKTITVRGNVATVSVASSVQNYYGSSATWDGSGDCLEFTNDADFRVGSGDFTIEGWFRTRTAGTQETYFALFGDSSSRRGILVYKDTSNVPRLELSSGTNSASTLINIQPSTSVVLGDWHHIAVERHEDTASIYLNGVAIGIATNVNSVPGSIYNNTTDPFQVGAYGGTNVQSFPWNGQISDLRFYKGVAKYKGGFDVPKPYTPVGIATWRAVPDCTANNFATWNPLSRYSTESSLGLSNGNLTATADASVNKTGTATVGVTTGKWYYEFSSTSANSYFEIGIGTYAGSGASINGLNYKCYSGNIEIENVSQTNVSSLGANEILGIALNATDGLTTFYKDGVQIANVSFTSPSGLYIPQLQSANGATHVGSANFGQNPTFSGQLTAGTYTDSNGKGLFKYQPPSGFLALCEDNLPTPAISDPGEYFKTVLYTGDGASGRSITGIGFTPDLVWIKERTSTSSHHLFDSVRGPGLNLLSNSTAAEAASSTQLYSFDSDGFSGGSSGGTNESGQNYVAWCWRAGAGTTSTNTDGSIQSVVSVNQDAGFSIVSFTGTGSAATVGHGLGKKPSFIIGKNRDRVVDWKIYLPNTGNYVEFSTAAQSSVSNAFTGATSSVLNLQGSGYGLNYSGERSIAYCWAEIEGFSKFGSYVGNGNADGPFVYCGFKPAWILIKKTDSSASWVLEDSARNSTNPAFSLLQPNTNSIEDNGSAALTSIDFLSNGFKIRGNWADDNASTSNYIFAAFAESPLQTANAK